MLYYQECASWRRVYVSECPPVRIRRTGGKVTTGKACSALGLLGRIEDDLVRDGFAKPGSQFLCTGTF